MGGYHVPVMLRESLEGLALKKGGRYLDATLGGAGHSRAILEALEGCGGGELYAIDRDREAIAEACRVVGLEPNSEERGGTVRPGVQFYILQGNFMLLDRLLQQRGVEALDGVLMDLGVSSHQLDAPERGFSFRSAGPLDMRMSDQEEGPTAAQLVAQAPLEELARILRYYGEERFAGCVAQAIVREREVRPISTTSHLAEVVERAIPQKAGKTHGGRAINPATRTFQALRIAVNRELESLQRGLEAAIGLLRPGGRLVVISYHSLEDRIVKEAIRSRLGHCTCPPRVPFCTCGAQATLREVTRRPLTPGEEELELNPRSRSAKLRVAERL